MDTFPEADVDVISTDPAYAGVSREAMYGFNIAEVSYTLNRDFIVEVSLSLSLSLCVCICVCMCVHAR